MKQPEKDDVGDLQVSASERYEGMVGKEQREAHCNHERRERSGDGDDEHLEGPAGDVRDPHRPHLGRDAPGLHVQGAQREQMP